MRNNNKKVRVAHATSNRRNLYKYVYKYINKCEVYKFSEKISGSVIQFFKMYTILIERGRSLN